MTREEAIKRIGDIKRNYKRMVEIMTDNEAEALDMAINALSAIDIIRKIVDGDIDTIMQILKENEE